MKSDSELMLKAAQIFDACYPKEMGFYSSSSRERYRKLYLREYVLGYKYMVGCLNLYLNKKRKQEESAE